MAVTSMKRLVVAATPTKDTGKAQVADDWLEDVLSVSRRDDIIYRTGEHPDLSQHDVEPDGDDQTEITNSDVLPLLPLALTNTRTNANNGSVDVHQPLKEGVYNSTGFGAVEKFSPWIPSVDPSRKSWSKKRHQRQFLTWSCLLVSLTVFSLNTGLYSAIRFWYSTDNDGTYILYHGDCRRSKRLSSGLHLVINIASTLLLEASNICIQLIAAPTRSEVDRAHSRGQWLAIGVPSWRNLKNLNWSSTVVCTILAFSSMPIHFLYNSVVFSTVSTNPYVYATATESFFAASGSNATLVLNNGSLVPAPTGIRNALDLHANAWKLNEAFGFFGYAIDDDLRELMMSIHEDSQRNVNTYTNLSNYECIKYYSSGFSWRPHVLLISEDGDLSSEHNSSLLTWGINNPGPLGTAGLFPYTWTADMNDLTAPVFGSELNMSTTQDWPERGNRIQYCLQVPNVAAEKSFDECRVICSPQILLIVIVFNGCKVLGILWTMYARSQNTLCTLGDAISSFLQRPDQHTLNCGLTSKAQVIECSKTGKFQFIQGARIWRPEDAVWWQLASSKRWIAALFSVAVNLLAGLIVLCTALLVIQKYQHNISPRTLFDLGFGIASWAEVISWSQPVQGQIGLFANILIANIWQVVVSLCYILQNALLSCLLLSREWNQFATQRKPLRVSQPRGIQRSTYFLSMPLRYGIPIMGIFALQHWLLSQSTFVMRVRVIDTIHANDFGETSWTTSGFSIMPAILSIILPTLYISILVIIARVKRFRSEMPLVSNCSLAISANCHRPPADVDAHLLPVMWGTIPMEGEGADEAQQVSQAVRVQHCSFTTHRDVSLPAPGSRVRSITPLPSAASEPTSSKSRTFRWTRWLAS